MATPQMLQKVFEIEQKSPYDILYIGEVKKIHDTSKGGDNRILVVTSNKVEYYKIKSNPAPDRFHYFSEIDRIAFQPGRIELYFRQYDKNPQMIRFETSSDELIGNSIKNLFFTILTDYILKRF